MSSDDQTRVPLLQRETIVPSSDRGRLAAVVATCSLAGLAGGMALSMVAETHRAAMADMTYRAPSYHAVGPITWLGVSTRPAEGRCGGARIDAVYSRSPAALAGFRRGDIVTSFGGDRVCDDDHLVDAVRASAIGAVPEVEIRRGAQHLELRPSLGVMPPEVVRRLPPDQR